MAGDPSGARWLLIIDTATSVVVVAAATPGGELIAGRSFEAGHRHGSHLLPTIEGLVRSEGLSLAALAGVVVGTGPGAFTGLRVGLSTAKTLAHETGVPIVGVSTGEALLAVEGGPGRRLLLAAGPHDRVLVVAGDAPVVMPGPGDDASADGTLAVDLDGRAPAAALEAGRAALAGLPATLARLGAVALASGRADDPALLVPEYVTLPRGAGAVPENGGVAWSRDPR